MLLEGMTPAVADTIFSRFGIPNASNLDKGELKNYYIALVKKHHPDVGGSNDDMRFINAAYDVLKTPVKSVVPKEKVDARLQKKSVQFRFDDETVIASGKSDYFDLIKIFQKLKLFRITVMFDPPALYDEVNKRWLTDKILIYVRSTIRSREYMINVIRGACETYF